ncbi:MAG TPA: hypothetical protein VHT29_12855 [Solirubrobacteraceae bacterium]|nr:hypothetical protein [Solirubrobacteraceae bacterium]
MSGLLGLCACGTQGPRTERGSQPGAATAATAHGPAFGLTEDDADLLWAPDAPVHAPRAFTAASRELTALHPTYVRLLVDWAALQPDPARPPELAAHIDGCARGVRPCSPYAGLRTELAAIASQQRAAGAAGMFQVVLDIFGVPGWAAQPPSGCELPGSTAFARPLRPQALEDYRALIRSLLTLARAEGVALEWWSPWNEPNDPRFISPQRAACVSDAPALSPALYAELARAMAAELTAEGAPHHLLLGELGDLEVDSPHTTSVASFVAALPADVLCLGSVWSIHAYARYGEGDEPVDAVGALEAALDARGGCARDAGIWVTEAGAGAPHPGQPRSAGGDEQAEGCRALAEQLLGWYRDPRVGAVFQYTFREDPDFPVGLVSADLSHLYPTYGLWLEYSRQRAAGGPPATASACA